jgi:hypothetical protein
LSDNVYIQSNEPEGNRVLAFRRDPDGTLIQRGTFSAGGAGTGPRHLQSQGPSSSPAMVATCSSPPPAVAT